MKKRAQNESIGLVIIVFLIVLIGVIAFRFMVSSGSDEMDEINRVTSSIKANSLVNSIAKVQINGKSIEENAQNCCENRNCDDFEREISKIFGKVVDGNYEFKLEKGSLECLNVETCASGAEKISSSMYSFRSRGKNYKISAILC